jgi:DNA polymerase I-like protein with 3'-5' exonuclease and polymerase domains
VFVILAQAERQAINSTVQGSAADVAKKAMVLVQSELQNMGYTSPNPVASLVLHLHDELLYEVSTHGIKLVRRHRHECQFKTLHLRSRCAKDSPLFFLCVCMHACYNVDGSDDMYSTR